MRTKQKIGIALMIIGAVLILGAASLIGYNRWADKKAGEASAALLTRIENQMPEATSIAPDPEASASASARGTDDGAEESPRKSAEPVIPSVAIDGNSYMGVLEIPAIEVTLPVLSDWNFSLLNIAPGRYEGSLDGGNLIIAGHNYTSHFGDLRYLELGDAVRITDVNGAVYDYTVTEIETIPKDAVEQMEEGDWDLTLFTCTIGAQERVTIRCTRT